MALDFYDVYGLGNALLDVEYEVKNPEILKAIGLKKGLMTLVSHEKQEEIIRLIGQENIRNKTSGGSVANSMAAVLSFGGKGFLSCRIAADETGEAYHQEMRRMGLVSNFDHRPKPQGTTGRCLVKITPDSDRTMSTYLGVSVDLSPSELNFEALSRSKFLYLEGYLLSSPSGLEAVKQAKSFAEKNDIKIALSLSDPSLVRHCHSIFKEVLENKINMLFANHDEALSLTQTSDLSEAIRLLPQWTHQFAITLGAKGSLVFDGTTVHSFPPEPANPIDTVGAGDMYAGSFLYGLAKGHSFLQSAKLAGVSSAYIVTQYGPRISIEVAPRLLQQAGLQ